MVVSNGFLSAGRSDVVERSSDIVERSTYASPSSSESFFLLFLMSLLEAPFTVIEGLLVVFNLFEVDSFLEVMLSVVCSVAEESWVSLKGTWASSSSEESPPASARSSASRSAILG